jgi:acetyl esterase/lipase
VAENASKLEADLTKGFIVAGTSAGGNLASVVAHEAVDAKLSPPITGQFLSVPVLVHPSAVPEKYKPHYHSWEQNKDAMILNQDGMLWFYGESQSVRE